MLLSCYYGFFQSLMVYGVTLWGNSPAAQDVLILQKKALRTMKGVKNSESCVPIFKEFNIMTLPCLYIYYCVVNVKENLHAYKKRHEVHHHETRERYKLDLPCIRLQKSKINFRYMKIILFNKLPEAGWTVQINRFKSVMWSWLVNKTFYSVNEFLDCDISNLRF